MPITLTSSTHSGILLIRGMFVFLIYLGFVLLLNQTAKSQIVVADDFYVVDKPQYLSTQLNDPYQNGGVQMVETTRAAHGSVHINNSDPYACTRCPYFTPSSTYIGFDFFRYQYVRCCASPPGPDSNIATVSLLIIGNDDAQNAGGCRLPVPSSVGQPVNVTNGNMWLEHLDYQLPGRGDIIEVNRFYNSIIQTNGLFGFGWSTKYDESITVYSDKMIRLNEPDGRAAYFGRLQTTVPYTSFSPDVVGQIVQNQNGTYTLTHKDGRVRNFSASGRLISSLDQNGNATVLTYDSFDRLTGVTDPAGRILTLTPNSDGTVAQISDSTGVIAGYEYFPGTTQLKTVTYPDGSKYKFEYNTTAVPGKVFLSTVKDALDNVLETHLYDSQGRATTSEKHGGVEKYTIVYSTVSNPSASIPGLTTVTDALGRVMKYHYWRWYAHNVVYKTEGTCSSCGGGSEVTQYDYDWGNSGLNLKFKQDALGRRTDYKYDTERNLIEEIDPLGTQKWTYNSRGQVLTYKDRLDQSTANNTVVNTYDASGNLLTTKDALNNTTTMTYTAQGQLATVKDARDNTTTVTYDTQGRLMQVRDADNKNTNFGYDARARVTSTTNALNETTSFTYDLNNRPKRVTFPDTNYVEHTYDLAGRRTATRDARNNTTTYAFDNAYRLTGVTDPLAHATTFDYDLMSNMTSQTDALGNLTNFEYDDFNRLKKVKYPEATTGATRLEESLTYDKVGNVKTRVDSAGRTTTYDYDTSNRLTKITDPALKLTQFEYNLRSHLTKVKDALNQEYTFAYDPLGRQLTQTRAGSTMSFEYDSVGNRTERTDYMGRVTEYEYDVLNRLKKINYVAHSPNSAMNLDATYTYDALSRLATAVNNVGTVAFTYDTRNRLKTETDVFGRVVEYGYDANGNRTQLKLDNSVHTAYAYDAANRLTTLTDDATQNFTYGYDIANRLVSKALPNGVTTTYEYDGMSRLTRLKDASTSATLFDRQYSYNNANQIAQIGNLTGTKIFGYDNIDRLTGMTNGASPESYTYNAVGSRTASHLSNSYTYQPFNRVTATQTGSYDYDANGNMTTKGEGSNFFRYTWDFENRMAEASTRRQRVRYKYDALGRRVRSFVAGNWEKNTKFTYDGLDVVMDDNNGTLTKYQNGPGIDKKLSLRTGADTKYFLADALGSTNGLVDSTGVLTSQTAYDSFGNATNANFPTRYQYTGREYDSFSGFHFCRARWYDAKLGRFISEDPIGFAGGDANLYGYVRNQPLIYRDPRGLRPGADVMNDPNIWRGIGAAAAAIAPYVPPVAVAAVGAGAIYGASHVGTYTASHPYNPFVQGPWPLNPFKPPFGYPVPVYPTPTTASQPYCQPRPVPFPWAVPYQRADPFPIPEPDREGCAEEISACIQLCAQAQGDSDRRGVWAGSMRNCMLGCVPERCQGKGGYQ